MIRVSELSKRFGPTVAVDRVSFEIGRGEVVGFLGPNGAGKTTTIRVLTGYHPATSGSALVAGFDVQTQSLEVRQQIGYLPQEVPIYRDMRVVEYLRYRAALKRVPRRERRRAVERAMEKAGIAEVARKMCGHVSHGYRQRVGLADALVANPPILILDEPTSGLDPNQRRRIKQVVRELANEHTVLFSSHILAEVQDVSSRVIVIHRGKVRADGAPQELVEATVQRTLKLVADATPERLAQVLAPLAALAEAVYTPEAAGGARMRCLLAPNDDSMRRVGPLLQQAGIAVFELSVEQPTLEEFFYAITEGDDRAEEERAEEGRAQAQPFTRAEVDA